MSDFQDPPATTIEAEPTTPAEVSEDAELDAIFDRMSGEADDAEPVAADAEPDDGPERDEKGRFKARADGADPEGAETAPEADAEAVEEPEKAEDKADMPPADTRLPKALVDAWKDMGEEARAAVLDNQKRLSDASAELGRLRKGVGPVHDELVKTIREFPEMANLRPEQVAADARELAKTRVQLKRDFTGTILRLAESAGQVEALKAAITGQPQEAQGEAGLVAGLRNEIAQLKATVQNLSNPDTIRGTVETAFSEQQAVQQVQQWADGKEHYATVEQHMPYFVNVAMQQRPGASQVDILDAAYDMATKSFGLTATPPEPAAPAPDEAGTRRAEAAIRAKSVNRQSRGTKPTQLTEDQQMDAVWDRMRSA